MYTALINRMLRGMITQGALTVTFPDGAVRVFGPGGNSGPQVAVRMLDPGLPRKLVHNPELALGEAYMDGRIEIGNDDLRGLLEIVATNARSARMGRLQSLLERLRVLKRRWTQINPLPRARRNVEVHYDLSTRLYETFLDRNMQYTCGYFTDPGMDIDAAQQAKMDHIAAKLCIRPGMKVLDIGCGWGGLAIRLARDHGARVTGISLSQVQLDHARAWAGREGVADRVDFRLLDYRHLDQVFDRIVVVGMLEHVGLPQYAAFFRQLSRCLAPDGIALVHTIGRQGPGGGTSPWIDKYIFPGGYCPSASEVLPHIETERLCLADLETWRNHYVWTLQRWLARFDASRPAVLEMYDERFIRMWRYYLLVSEMSFSKLGHCVFQFQLTHDNLSAPLTRDYLYHRQ